MNLRSNVTSAGDSARPPAEPAGSAALGSERASPPVEICDQARPSPGFSRQAATIRIVGPGSADELVIEIPAIESDRPEFDYTNEEEPW